MMQRLLATITLGIGSLLLNSCSIPGPWNAGPEHNTRIINKTEGAAFVSFKEGGGEFVESTNGPSDTMYGFGEGEVVCADTNELQFSGDTDRVPPGMVIGTRDKKWCIGKGKKHPLTIEYIPASKP